MIFNVRSRVGAARAAPLGWIRDLVDAVDRADFDRSLTHLVSYFTRHSTSADFAAAATWAKANWTPWVTRPVSKLSA